MWWRSSYSILVVCHTYYWSGLRKSHGRNQAAYRIGQPAYKRADSEIRTQTHSGEIHHMHVILHLRKPLRLPANLTGYFIYRTFSEYIFIYSIHLYLYICFAIHQKASVYVKWERGNSDGWWETRGSSDGKDSKPFLFRWNEDQFAMTSVLFSGTQGYSLTDASVPLDWKRFREKQMKMN